MPDPTVVVDRDGTERARHHVSDLLTSAPLHEQLEVTSWDTLRAALASAPIRGVELFTHDGRVLDATLDPVGDPSEPVDDRPVAVVLRDVTRYADAAEQLGSMAMELTRTNRDLRTLYEATARLGGTLDVAELGTRTSRIVTDYLDADAVALELYGDTFVWPRQVTPDEPPSGAMTLRTARGELGTVRWWRTDPLTPNEQDMVQLLISRAAIGLDHALLLSDAEDRAHRDTLTGLLNRAGAHRALAGFAKGYGIVLIDLDHFKQINDRHGHAEGDRVLQQVAAVLSHGRSSDVRARWGGEEFLVALDGADVDQTRDWAQARLDEVRRQVQVGGRPVTFSAGVALVRQGRLDDALARADTALYAAKDDGRDRVVVA